MAERLYYYDSFFAQFEARVLSSVPAGAQHHVILDRTAFYPTSGGQPNDTGRLGEAGVLDVLETEDGEILHVTDRAVPQGPVHGEVNWEQRFDHMQQHTGQHLLSALFLAMYGYPTVSFHLGRELSTIDLDAPQAGISPEQFGAVERRANEIIFEDRPVHVRFGTREEFAAAGIRKEVQREGLLRAIEIEGVELNPCGGTHVARTGQIGLLLLRKSEKQKGNWRVEFVCGARALAAAREDRKLLMAAARTLGGAALDVPVLVARAAEERREGERLRKDLQSRLADYEAREMCQQAEALGGGVSIVSRVVEGASPEHLRQLATKIVELGNGRALLGARPSGHLVFAQPAGLQGDMNALLRDLLGQAGGKGGGTRDFAQGNLPDPGRLEDVLRAASARLSSSAAAGE